MTQHTKPAPDAKDTAPCIKCRSEIPTDAERCPQCRYEPGNGILTGIKMWVKLIIGNVFALFFVIYIMFVAPPYSGADAAIIIGSSFLAVFSYLGIYYDYKDGKLGPADESV
jgi:hypothetical protein